MMRKDPAAILPFAIDWTDWEVGEADTITDATWTVPTALTKETELFADGIATVWLSGGTAGVTYECVCHVTTSGGREDERTLRIRVENR